MTSTDRTEASDGLPERSLEQIRYTLDRNLFEIHGHNARINALRVKQRKLIEELKRRGIRDEFELQQTLDREKGQ